MPQNNAPGGNRMYGTPRQDETNLNKLEGMEVFNGIPRASFKQMFKKRFVKLLAGKTQDGYTMVAVADGPTPFKTRSPISLSPLPVPLNRVLQDQRPDLRGVETCFRESTFFVSNSFNFHTHASLLHVLQHLRPQLVERVHEHSVQVLRGAVPRLALLDRAGAPLQQPHAPDPNHFRKRKFSSLRFSVPVLVRAGSA